MLIFFSCLFLILLLFFPKISLAGSQYGFSLWLLKLFPTLFPFFIAIRLFQLSMPKIAEKKWFLLTGLLCGYPTGAVLVSDQYKKGILSLPKAYFFLGFVNNPSPMFILAFCGINLLQLSMNESAVLLMIVLSSSLFGSLFFSAFFSMTQEKAEKKQIGTDTRSNKRATVTPAEQKSPATDSHHLSKQLDRIILDSFILLAKIGGYVILFSILGQFIWKILPGTSTPARIFRILATSTLEITSGVSYLVNSSVPIITKKVLTTAILTFGGLSAAAQTSSILSESGLSVPLYVLNKGINSLFALLLSILIFYIL